MLLQAVNFVLLPLYTHYLEPSDFGILEILNRTGDILVVLLMANGIRAATFTFYCQADSNQARVRNASTVALVMWSGCLLGLLFSIAFAPVIGNALGIENDWLTILGLAAAISQMLPALPMALMQTRVESIAFVWSSVFTLVTRLSVIVLCVVIMRTGVWGVLMGTLVANVGAGCILSFREFSKSGFRPDLTTLFPVIRFAWPFVPGGLIGFAMMSGDRYFLLNSAGPESLGIYSLGARLASVVTTVCFAPFFKVWSASMYTVYQSPNSSQVVGQMFTRLLAPSVFAGLLVFLFRSEILQLLASPEYSGAATIIGPMIISSLLITAQILGDGAFYVYRRSRTKLCVTIGSTIVALVLYSVLIPLFEMWGAALAVVLSSTFYASATLMTAQTVFRIQFEWGRLLALAGITLILAVTSNAVSPDATGIAIKVALAFAYPVFLWKVNIISQEEKVTITRAFLTIRRFLRRLTGFVRRSEG